MVLRLLICLGVCLSVRGWLHRWSAISCSTQYLAAIPHTPSHPPHADNRLASHLSCLRRASFLFATEAGVPLEVGPSLDVEEDAAVSTRAVDETLEVEASFAEDEEDEGLI